VCDALIAVESALAWAPGPAADIHVAASAKPSSDRKAGAEPAGDAAMSLNFAGSAISSDVLRKWQGIVDLLANVMHVPSAVVCKLEPPHYTHYSIVASSNSDGNPFPCDDTFAMNIGTFCETVIKNCEPLLVVNALADDGWKLAPEIKVGMVSYLGIPICWHDGRVFGTICVLDNKANEYSDVYQELLRHCRDVLQTDLLTLVRLSDELEQQKAQLSELFARVPQAVVLINRESRVTRVNPEFTKIFGYTADEAIGSAIKKLIAPDDLHNEAEGFLHRMFEAEETFTVRTVSKHKNDMRVPVSVTYVPVGSTDGGKAGYLIYRDMTDEMRFEEEQRRYQQIKLELVHVNRIATLAQLSAAIAHELSQPLTGIITNSRTCLRMLTGNPENVEGAREAVRRTLRDGDRASDVIARLRALFSNKELVYEPVDLNQAAQEVVALSVGELHSGHVTLRTELANDLPRVMADRVQLQQVILNLLRNALEAMSAIDDRPKELLVKTDQAEDGSVRLSVRDAGSGFDPQAMHKLFTAFYSTKKSGMGVGLAVSNSIIEKHHGLLSATLNNGPGATFSFSIPIRS
jgi:PAS domain S-box-containing protein